MSKVRIATVALLCAAAIAGVLIFRSWGRQGGSPNVILVCVDTLRGDHVQAAGYERDTTPNLDRLIERGVYFPHAYSQYTSTWISIGSLFASRYGHHFISPVDRSALGRIRPYAIVPADFPVMPEYFKSQGYRTVAVSSNPFLTPQWGFDRGFDEFHVLPGPRDDPEGLELYPRAAAVNDFLLDRYDEGLKDASPLFLYLHYMDPHQPYLPLAPFKDRYIGDRKRSPRLTGGNIPAS